MNVRSWLQQHQIDSELILAHVLNKDPTFFVLHPEYKLSSSEQALADQLSLRRQYGEPLAYLLGYKDFYGRRFFVNSDVLIPRPESEAIIDLAKNLWAKLSPQKSQFNILDLGTGSGCLAITLKLELPTANLTASDCSQPALNLAQQNAERFHVPIRFRKSHLLAQFPHQHFDLIVANLPYVDRSWPWLNHATLKFEPTLALFALDHGLELIKQLLLSVANFTQYLIIEADPSQHTAIRNFAKNHHIQHLETDGFSLLFYVFT